MSSLCCASPRSRRRETATAPRSAAKIGGIHSAMLRRHDRGARIERAQARDQRLAGSGDARSILVTTMVSASIACRRASANLVERRQARSPHRQPQSPSRHDIRRRARDRSQSSSGSARDRQGRMSRSRRAGNAAPVRARDRRSDLRSATCRSERTLQHRQPLPSSRVSSALARSSTSSIPASPNSLTIERGAVAVLAFEKVLHQRGLAGTEKSGNDNHRDACAARVTQSAAETARHRGSGRVSVHAR